MNLRLEAPVLALQRGEVITLDDARGVRICPRGAKVWVTEEGDSSDFVVNPGEDFVVTRAGRTVVQAIDTTWVDLKEAA